MNPKVTAFIDELIIYDYVLFASSFTLFILFIVLTIILHKKIGVAIFFLILAFSALLIMPSYGYIVMHNYLFKNSVTLERAQKLLYSEALLVRGVVTNESRFDFSSCRVSASVYRVTQNKYKNYLLKFKPFMSSSIVTPEIAQGESHRFEFFVEPFTYSNEYNITLGADCK